MSRERNNKAIAILRVSSLRQKDNTSHETQEKEVISYCGDLCLKLIRVFPIIESAKDSDNRKEYNFALDWGMRNDARHILFYIYDRESRNLTDNERNEKLIRTDKIVIHYVKEKKVIHSDSPDSEFFLRDINAVTNKHFIRNLRSKVIDAQRTKAESGWLPGNHVPLGYCHVKIKDSDGKELKRGTTIGVTLNQKEVSQVIREYELRGYHKLSLSQIRKTIISEGYVSTEEIRGYHTSAIERRLKSRFYRGYFTYRGVEYQGKHELFISKELRDAVDETIGEFGYSKPSRGIFGNGWIKCAVPRCGCNIVYDPKRKKIKETGEIKLFPYYHCTNGRGVHKTLVGMNITEDELFKQFGSALDRISISKYLAQKIADALNSEHRVASSALKKEIESYRLGLDQLERKEDSLYDDLKIGILDEVGYQRQLNRVREERRRLTDLLESSSKAINGQYLETAKSTLELASNLKLLWLSRSREERRDLLNLVLSNPKLDGLTVYYDLKKPFKTISKMREDQSWRPQLDNFRTELLSIIA